MGEDRDAVRGRLSSSPPPEQTWVSSSPLEFVNIFENYRSMDVDGTEVLL